MPPYRNYIYEYHAKITSGEIIAGKWIKKIYEIIINGLQKQEYFFNAKAANKAIRFIENFCHHSKGRNDLIKLELWQKAIVSVIFGIQDAEKIRIFREIFIVIGRKNGKSKSRTTENKNLSVRDFFEKQRLVLCASSEADCEYPIRNDDCE